MPHVDPPETAPLPVDGAPPISSAAHSAPAAPRARRLFEIAAAFLRLGCISFGGPIAHLGYLRAEFVERRRWLDDASYGDVVALCQFLPGPASSQVVFALGLRRAGLLGALLASVSFTLPSALLMLGLAYGVAPTSDLDGAGWLQGLKLAAVAVVAQAAWGMGKRLCPDRARFSLCVASAALLLTFPGALTQLSVLAAGGLVGWWLYRGPRATRRPPHAAPAPAPAYAPRSAQRWAGGAALTLFGGLLVALPALEAASTSRGVALFDSFYRAGSLVFGGGHVVLPLLHVELVPRGWLTDAQFLAGYGAAQALPGPLFALSAYLGAAMSTGPGRWIGGLGCLCALFLPAWLLIGGALPFWQQLREKRGAQAALAGANAAVVGVLMAALYDPVFTTGVHDAHGLALALIALGLLEQWRVPPWLVVAGSAAAGQWLLGA